MRMRLLASHLNVSHVARFISLNIKKYSCKMAKTLFAIDARQAVPLIEGIAVALITHL